MTIHGRSRPEQGADVTPLDPHGPPAIDRRDGQPTASSLGARFAESPDFTVGVEEELQLVDPEGGHLVDRPEPIAAAMATSGGRLQPEIFRSTVETTTPVCGDVTEMAEEMRRLRAWVVEAGEDQGLAVAASGTHPFARWEAEPKTEARRYEALLRDIQMPVRRDLVFGQHVHVAVGSGEEAIAVTNDLQAFLPLLLALSANAPFWRGLDTGLQSARVNVAAGMPRSGPAPVFAGWEAFQAHLDLLRRAGAIEDVTKVWWDVRPRPKLGTVEVRIADLPTDVEASISLAALTHALVVHLAKRHRRDEPPARPRARDLVRENRWRALRWGLEAEFVDVGPEGDPRLRSVGETFARTVGLLEPTIERLGLEHEIGHLRERIEEDRSGAERQRRVYEREADLSAVVRDLVTRTPP